MRHRYPPVVSRRARTFLGTGLCVLAAGLAPAAASADVAPPTIVPPADSTGIVRVSSQVRAQGLRPDLSAVITLEDLAWTLPFNGQRLHSVNGKADLRNSRLTVEGISIRTIGYFALVGLPYTFKFVWAPLLDRFEPRWLGRRRAWILAFQLLLAGACFAMARLDPAVSVPWIATMAVGISFLSASQDIVFDAYRADLLDPEERGAGAAVSVLGYRLASIHNVRYLVRLAERMRMAISEGTFREFAEEFVGGYRIVDPAVRSEQKALWLDQSGYERAEQRSEASQSSG